jgi:hypothetical protein
VLDSESKISNLDDILRVNKNIERFKISMDDILTVHILDAFHNLREIVKVHLSVNPCSLLKDLLQGLTRAKFHLDHDVKREVVFLILDKVAYSWVSKSNGLATAAWGRWLLGTRHKVMLDDLAWVVIIIFLIWVIVLKGVPFILIFIFLSFMQILICAFHDLIFNFFDLGRLAISLAVSSSNFVLLLQILFFWERIQPACLISHYIYMVDSCHRIDLSENFMLSNVILYSQVYLDLLEGIQLLVQIMPDFMNSSESSSSQDFQELEGSGVRVLKEFVDWTSGWDITWDMIEWSKK